MTNIILLNMMFGIWKLMWNHVYGWNYGFGVIPMVSRVDSSVAYVFGVILGVSFIRGGQKI